MNPGLLSSGSSFLGLQTGVLNADCPFLFSVGLPGGSSVYGFWLMMIFLVATLLQVTISPPGQGGLAPNPSDDSVKHDSDVKLPADAAKLL